jgi:hypothetical protein
LLQLDPQGIARMQVADMSDAALGEVGMDMPVALLVGFGQSMARDGAADADVIQLFW